MVQPSSRLGHPRIDDGQFELAIGADEIPRRPSGQRLALLVRVTQAASDQSSSVIVLASG